MAKRPSKQVAKQDNRSVAAQGFEDHAGRGMENVTASDLLVPRISILQDLSPQLKKTKSEFIKGAKSGDICDVGTGELFGENIVFLPCYYRKDYLEWAPRSSGQGLVNLHSDPAILGKCHRDERNRPILDNGNYIAETAQMFGLNLSAEGRKSFIPMASTQLKKARKWMTLATGEKLERADGSTFVPPLFFRTYLLTTAEESNNDGEWTGWVVNRGLSIPELPKELCPQGWESMRDDCINFIESLVAGEMRADVSQMEDSENNDDRERM